MQKSRFELVALIATVAASALALLLPLPYAWVTSISGLALLIMLCSYEGDADRTAFQSLAFASACGMGVMLLLDVFYRWLAANGEVHMSDGRVETRWLPLTWAGATLAVWAIDRIRLGRGTAKQVAGPVQRSFIPQYAEPVPAGAPAYVAATAPAPPPPPAPVSFTPQPAPTVATPPVAVQPPPPPAPATVSIAPQPTPVAAAQVAAPPPAPPLPQADIYVTLVGEGLNLMRTVRAEHLGRDFYRILEEMPPGETWEFTTGQVVRVKKRNLSTGKGLVAVEEAPRAS